MKYSKEIQAVKNLALSAVFAGLVALGAILRFDLPFSPVPITLQTFFVLLAGMFLPPLWAGASIGLYLFAGIIGLPVFAGGTGGFPVILGPTGGFLIGFVVAAVLVSLYRSALYRKIDYSRARSIGIDLSALVLGTLIIYAIGYPWIVLNLGWDWRIGLARSVLPFVPGDILKIVAAMLVIPIVQGRFARSRSNA